MSDDIDPRDAAIQQRLDNGQHMDADEDVLAYQAIFDRLGRSDVRLPASFARRVALRSELVRQRARTSVASLAAFVIVSFATVAALASLRLLDMFGIGVHLDWAIVNQLKALPVTATYLGGVMLALLVVDVLTDRHRHHGL